MSLSLTLLYRRHFEKAKFLRCSLTATYHHYLVSFWFMRDAGQVPTEFYSQASERETFIYGFTYYMHIRNYDETICPRKSVLSD